MKLDREELLQFLSTYQEENGYSPTIREIATGIGVNSTQTVYRCLCELREEGVVKWQPGFSRTLKVVKDANCRSPRV